MWRVDYAAGASVLSFSPSLPMLSSRWLSGLVLWLVQVGFHISPEHSSSFWTGRVLLAKIDS